MHNPFHRDFRADDGIYGSPDTKHHSGRSLPLTSRRDTRRASEGTRWRAFSSVDLVDAYIERIEQVNPFVRAVTEINPDARSIAAQRDAERKQGHGTLGPLYGIPVLVKNNIATADAMNNTAGSYALLGAKVPEDSHVVARLRNAGAIILGKTNLSQPARLIVRSAVASSIGLAWAALGTDSVGSITAPAHVANVVAVKPTLGLTSRYLVIPYAEHADTIGPIARSVKDAAYLLSAIAGVDHKDGYTSEIPQEMKNRDYSKACTISGLEGRRLGVPRHLLSQRRGSPGKDSVARSFDAALDVMKNLGADIVDVELPGVKKLLDSHVKEFLAVLDADFVTNLSQYLSQLTSNPNKVNSLESVLEFTQNSPEEEYPRRNTVRWEQALARGYDNTAPKARQHQKVIDDLLGGPDGLDGVLRKKTLDAVIFPSTELTLLTVLIGSPIITVPLGFAPDTTPSRQSSSGYLNETGPNAPFGLAFAGSKWSEELLFGMAYAWEQASQVRGKVKPFVQPKTELEDIVRRTS
ncbi:hypothetical protein ACCO45_007401 [Purpureocillium lilacinum]|uniref:Uncharacterized protein n=1 Tax=Purpureocillium lilacinum TaxID=33203 RepID=A0ACC4DSC7_PURLI